MAEFGYPPLDPDRVGYYRYEGGESVSFPDTPVSMQGGGAYHQFAMFGFNVGVGKVLPSGFTPVTIVYTIDSKSFEPATGMTVWLTPTPYGVDPLAYYQANNVFVGEFTGSMLSVGEHTIETEIYLNPWLAERFREMVYVTIFCYTSSSRDISYVTFDPVCVLGLVGWEEMGARLQTLRLRSHARRPIQPFRVPTPFAYLNRLDLHSDTKFVQVGIPPPQIISLRPLELQAEAQDIWLGHGQVARLRCLVLASRPLEFQILPEVFVYPETLILASHVWPSWHYRPGAPRVSLRLLGLRGRTGNSTDEWGLDGDGVPPWVSLGTPPGFLESNPMTRCLWDIMSHVQYNLVCPLVPQPRLLQAAFGSSKMKRRKYQALNKEV